jgi:hypothetical protein
MSDQDREKERRATNTGTRRNWASLLVNPSTLKAVLATGQLAMRIVQVILESVKLFQD